MHEADGRGGAKAAERGRGRRSAGNGDPVRGEQMREQEICRMAAFRVRETANRIATLANSAGDAGLRRDLLAVCQRLLREERALLDLSVSGPTGAVRPAS